MYILMIIFSLPLQVGNAPGSISAEFNSFKACKDAADTISSKGIRVQLAVCAAKGEKK